MIGYENKPAESDGQLVLLPAIEADSVGYLAKVMAAPGVMPLFDRLLQVDETTAAHCLRVGERVIDAMSAGGYPEEDIIIGGIAGVLHDIGKVDDTVQRAIHSPETVQQNPGLYRVIMLHPVLGAKIVARNNFSPNIVQAVGMHHAFQGTNRPSYGIASRIVGVAEEDGHTPDTLAIGQILAVSDVADAMFVDTGRIYRQHTCCSIEDTRQEINGLRVEESIKKLVITSALKCA